LIKAGQFGDITIRNINGFPIKIRDVAKVEEGAADDRSRVRLNGKASISAGVIRQATANPLELSKGVRDMMPRLQQDLPGDVTIDVANDNSVFIDRSIKAVYQTILEAVLLVALVIFVFLRTLRASLIPLVTIPVCLIGSFALMAMFGFTINSLTMLALVLAIGLVVDDAIVVLENISRHIERGLSPFRATLKGSSEVGFTLLAMNLSLVAVFVSILFMGGLVEKLFREFSITLAAAMLVSLVVSLTLTPSLCARILVRPGSRPMGAFRQRTEAAFEALKHGYARTLAWVLEHATLTLIILLGTSALNGLALHRHPQRFLAAARHGYVAGIRARG